MKGITMDIDLVRTAVFAALLALPSAALAHGTADHAKKASAPSRPKNIRSGLRVTRERRTALLRSRWTTRCGTRIRKSVSHRARPSHSSVTNKGKLMHELVLGTEDELKTHAADDAQKPGHGA